MAKFVIKASEFKNVCKAVNDRKLAELKKEIIEILKKQEEREVKKAVEFFEAQEAHYTHLEKSTLSGKWVEKAGYGIGTVRVWKGKKYKKIAPGKWARMYEKEGRGTNIAIGKLIARVQNIDNVEDLMAFVQANKQRFVDENGVDLPVLDKLRVAVDAKNGTTGSSKPAEKKNISDDVATSLNEMAESKKSGSKIIGGVKVSYDPQNGYRVTHKAPSGKELTAGYDGIEEAHQAVMFRLNRIKNGEIPAITESETNKENQFEGIVSDLQTIDWSETTGKEVDDVLRSLKSDEDKKAFVEFIDGRSDLNKFQKQMISDALKGGSAYGDFKTWLENNDIVPEEYAGKSKNEIVEMAKKTGLSKKDAEKAAEDIKSYLAEDEEKKDTFEDEMNRLNDAQEAAWEDFESGSEIKATPENSKKFYDKVKKFVDENNIKLTKKHHDEIEEMNGHSFNEALALAGAYGEEEKKKALEWNKETNKKYKGAALDLSQIDEFKESETEEKETPADGGDTKKDEKRDEPAKETEPKKTSSAKTQFKRELPYGSLVNAKDDIGTFTKAGDGKVEMPATKEVAELFDSLNKTVSQEKNRTALSEVYYDGDNFISTDARRLVSIKAGNIGLNEGYVKIDTNNGTITVSELPEKTKESEFANWKRVMPPNNTQEVKFDNKALKDKLKAMKKEGAINKNSYDIDIEFKDGKAYIDGTVVGSGDVKFPNGEEPFIKLNGFYLMDAALAGDSSSMFLDEKNPADRAADISTNNSDILIMSMSRPEKANYEERRKDKADKKAEKDAEKARNRELNQERVSEKMKAKLNIDAVDKLANRFDKVLSEMDDERLKREYERFKFNLNKAIDKKYYPYDSAKVDNKLGLDFHGAVMYKLANERHPEIKDKIYAEIERRGLDVKKSIFSDFLIESFIDEEEEDEEEESLWNDYSAEQPELFNSTELMVREALNRRRCL